METRKNTLKLCFGSSVKVPAHLDVLRFVAQSLKIPASFVHSVYKDENDQSFFVKFMDEDTFNKFFGQMEEQYRFQFGDGAVTGVRLAMASRQFRYIRIFNLPPETEDKDIAAVMSRFGKIRQHVRERYPSDYSYPVFSGIRGVHMEVEKEIPANVFIGHFRARIFYEGLKNKCFFCKAEGHVKVNCPKMASLKNAQTGGERLYSQVAANIRIGTGDGLMNDQMPSSSMTVLPLRKPPAPVSASGDSITTRMIHSENHAADSEELVNEAKNDGNKSSAELVNREESICAETNAADKPSTSGGSHTTKEIHSERIESSVDKTDDVAAKTHESQPGEEKSECALSRDPRDTPHEGKEEARMEQKSSLDAAVADHGSSMGTVGATQQSSMEIDATEERTKNNKRPSTSSSESEYTDSEAAKGNGKAGKQGKAKVRGRGKKKHSGKKTKTPLESIAKLSRSKVRTE